MAEAKLTGGEALAQALARAGVDFVFGIPGGGQYEAVDGLYGESTISYIATRHEQAASYMADGYARVSGRVAGQTTTGAVRFEPDAGENDDEHEGGWVVRLEEEEYRWLPP